MINFSNVGFTHQNGFVALRDINLKIERGETIAIVGENGAGKTTLVRHMNGLLKPTKGTVFVDGEDTRQKSTAQLSRRVGIAFQNPDHQLFSDSLENEITFALRNFGFSEETITQRLDWALNFFNLEQYRKASPLILSGGEKKRLTLACILAWDPEVIILDEPTVGQDAIQKEKLAEIVKMFRSTGKTVVIVSHDVEFIWPLQPRLIIMAGGEIRGDGPARELMRDRELLGRARVTQPQLLQIYSQLEVSGLKPFVDVLEARRYISGMVNR
jgi:energy-coupling factor transport system ATP-binding protein